MKPIRFIIFVLATLLVVTPLIYVAHAKSTGGPEPSLILYLPFDEGEGAIAGDVSKYGNHGTLQGMKPDLPKWVPGKFGQALEFNGKNNWVEVPHKDILSVDQAVTVMAWINPKRHTGGSTKAQWAGIVTKGNNPRSYSFYTDNGAKNLHFSSMGGSGNKTKIELNKWQHVVAQHTGKSHIYYLNGELDGESPGKAALPGTKDKANVMIARSHEGAREFEGIIDEVKIWNRVLSAKEVQHHMNIGKGQVAVEPDGKLATTWSQLKGL
jgi:hypothetical protein